jgi:hypothetical protein
MPATSHQQKADPTVMQEVADHNPSIEKSAQKNTHQRTDQLRPLGFALLM